MRLAVLFSGQGGQTRRHLSWLAAHADAPLGAALDACLGTGWADEGTAGFELHANRTAQPVVFAYQCALWHALRVQLPTPVCLAGHSLGEVAACAAAGMFTPEDGVHLCARRAAAMDDCAQEPGGLVAVLGLLPERVQVIARDCGVDVAIRNAPEHLVLGGTLQRLEQATCQALAAGARRVVRLEVGTPSHTPRLAAAGASLAHWLAPYADGALALPVMGGMSGRLARDAATAAASLAGQLWQPLDWEACQVSLQELRPDVLLELGPGTALARLWADRDTGIPIRAADDFRSLDGVVRWVLQAAG